MSDGSDHRDSETNVLQPPFTITAVLHEDADPTQPFLHALGLASSCKGELEIVDFRNDGNDTPHLGVRKTFEHWRKLPAGSKREDVERLGLRVTKIRKHGHSRREITRRLDRHAPDLLVIGTHQRRGLGGLLVRDLAEYLAISRRQTTLYVPDGSKPFVAPDSGRVNIRTILLPVAEIPAPEPPLQFIRRLQRVALTEEGAPHITGLHIGDHFPFISATALEGIPWEEICEPPTDDSLAGVITQTAVRCGADLVVMGTNGRDTLSQRIVGSITEQVLKIAPCPVLAVAAS